jgi:hypothetical protein
MQRIPRPPLERGDYEGREILDENGVRMLRDERSERGRRPPAPRNVFGEPLEICSIKPMTGFYRDGCCDTGPEDVGSHTVCAVMAAEFLEFSNRAATI